MRERTFGPRVAGFAALFFGIAVLPGAAQPVISQGGVVNAASFRPADFPGAELAPGGMISIFGSGLGPAAGVQAGAFPLPEELGPQRTRVQINEQLMCRLLYVSDAQVNCQLPLGLAGDRIRIRVMTTQGTSNTVEAPFGPMGCGLFTQARNGRGPLLAQNFEDVADPANRFRMNGVRDSARPGQVMVLWGTGLGATNPPVAAGDPTPGQAPAVEQPEVFVAGMRAQVQYAGRAPGFAGLDQIQIVIPAGVPDSCAAPVRLQQMDRTSNIGTIAIHRNGGVCRDAFNITSAGESFGQVVLASGLGRLGPGQLGAAAGYGGPYPTRPSPFNPVGPNRGPGGGVRSGAGGVGNNGIGPYGLHPGIPSFAGGLGLGLGQGPGMGMTATGPNMALAQFVRLAEDASLDIGVPPAATDSCNSYPIGPNGIADIVRGAVQRLDAGTIDVTGPGVSLTLTPIQTALGPLYMAPLPAAIEQGDYATQGMGGAEVGAFGPATMTVSPPVTVTTSLAAGTQVSRAAGLTLSWTGGDPNDLVVIHGRSFLIPPTVQRPVSDPMQFRSQAFVCTTTAGALSFTVPPWALALLPDGLLTLNVTHMPPAEGVTRFEATGLDAGGVFRWVDTTTFLDLEVVP
ncbi:MAG: hypothetical protein GC160_25955 [Acidobacteria bacterium]|nr:hypothetical protein [Acidobacteriota bacterium]